MKLLDTTKKSWNEVLSPRSDDLIIFFESLSSDTCIYHELPDEVIVFAISNLTGQNYETIKDIDPNSGMDILKLFRPTIFGEYNPSVSDYKYENQSLAANAILSHNYFEPLKRMNKKNISKIKNLKLSTKEKNTKHFYSLICFKNEEKKIYDEYCNICDKRQDTTEEMLKSFSQYDKLLVSSVIEKKQIYELFSFLFKFDLQKYFGNLVYDIEYELVINICSMEVSEFICIAKMLEINYEDYFSKNLSDKIKLEEIKCKYGLSKGDENMNTILFDNDNTYWHGMKNTIEKIIMKKKRQEEQMIKRVSNSSFSKEELEK